MSRDLNFIPVVNKLAATKKTVMMKIYCIVVTLMKTVYCSDSNPRPHKRKDKVIQFFMMVTFQEMTTKNALNWQ